MKPDIKRQVELFVVSRLSIALPDQKFYPFTGGDAINDASEIEPPFTIVAITDAERTMATEGTWLCRGQIQVVTHHAEASAQAQAVMAREVYKALDNIGAYTDGNLSIHGIDIEGMRSTSEETLSVRADIISFTVGAGG